MGGIVGIIDSPHSGPGPWLAGVGVDKLAGGQGLDLGGIGDAWRNTRTLTLPSPAGTPGEGVTAGPAALPLASISSTSDRLTKKAVDQAQKLAVVHQLAVSQDRKTVDQVTGGHGQADVVAGADVCAGELEIGLAGMWRSTIERRLMTA